MRLSVNKTQMDFLRKIGIEDKDYTEEEIEDDIIGKLVCHLTAYGFKDSEYNETNETGDMCESIIDALTGGGE